MHIHILGICGTFMGSLAQLAKAQGHRVTGSDANVYPPMSTQLEAVGIELIEGFDAGQVELNPDVFVIGNVVSRGNPLMEEILNRGLAYISGPQWLAENILRGRWVLAVSGTHGKTTTSSMLAWILDHAGYAPGFLIGGVPANFPHSARLGESDFFVIEADEYDTAFFDKRSKFLHYHPRTLAVNNLEYDHADIFPDVQAIQTQFHHLVRTVPALGLIIHSQQKTVQDTLARGCWSECQSVSVENEAKGDWDFELLNADYSAFSVIFRSQVVGKVEWSLSGKHNIYNALSAIASARHVGVEPVTACLALNEFRGVKRRLEFLGQRANLSVYDDFAHHPTAIATTIEALRKRYPADDIIAVIEPRSNTMKQGVHQSALLDSIKLANRALWYQDPAVKWDLSSVVSYSRQPSEGEYLSASAVYRQIDDIISFLTAQLDRSAAAKRAHVLIMSNGGFQNIHRRVLAALAASLEKGE